MKKDCIQCGKEFQITEPEMEYWKQNNMKIPDCCMTCRRENRRASYKNRQVQNSSRKSMKFLGIVLVLVFLFLALWSGNGGRNLLQGVLGRPSAGEESENLKEVRYAFRSFQQLEEHYKKHGMDMGFRSKEEYLVAANKVIANQNSLHKKEAEDKDDVYFLESTKELVILSTDGYIRTYFIPEDGIKYYNRQ